jgi:hypothetical protein
LDFRRIQEETVRLKALGDAIEDFLEDAKTNPASKDLLRDYAVQVSRLGILVGLAWDKTMMIIDPTRTTKVPPLEGK